MTEARWDRYPDRATARRAAARTLHPDRGGNPAAFTAALVAIDAHFSVASPAIVVHRRRRTLPVHALLPLRRLRTRRRRFIEL